MKLDDFLKHPTFSKYSNEVKSFKADFVAEGCEAFLWMKFSEQAKAINNVSKVSLAYGKVDINPHIEKLIEQLPQYDEEYIAFIYPEDYSPKYLLAQEVAKKAVKSYIIENIFAEDDTKNWIALFDPKDEQSVCMMYYLVYAHVGYTGDVYGGYKLFGKGLMYYAEFLQYEGKVLGKHDRSLVHFQGVAIRRDTNPRIILESRRVSKMLVRLGYFKDEYELFCNLWRYLLPPLQKIYEKARDYIESCNGFELGKMEVKQLQSQMVADGIILSKWKSEQTLFTMVKKVFPDALFQFRPVWLEPQNLDIYIPSINVGIEYQGIQHYESVDFFGGEEAFNHRKQLDERKNRLCKENNLRLIAWPYTEDISIKNLKNKIQMAEQ